MKNLRDKLNELNTLIVLCRYDEALERLYDDHVVTHENENAPTVGLATYKEAARKIFYDNVSNYSAELLNTIIGDEITVCQWHYKFDHKFLGHWDKIQISVQRWSNSKIIHERHYYND